MNSHLNHWLSSHQKDLCRFLQDLVRIPTTNPPGENYADVVAVMEAKLKSLNMTTQVVRVPDDVVQRTLPDCDGYPRFNLIGRWDVGAQKTLHFNAHYDVVPVSGNWKFGPFEPKIEDGWLYGRGSSDMKGCIAACVFAIQAAQEAGITPKVNVEVSFTADEEIGGVLGAGYVVKQGLVKPDYAIVCEGGSEKNIGYGHNGVIWFNVTVHGKAAHASRPERGINAFENAAALVMELQKLKKALSQKSRVFETESGKTLRPTVNVGGVFGVGAGAKVNTVPAQASFTIDRRVTPSEKSRDAEREIRDAIAAAKKKIKGLRVDAETFMRIDPCTVPPSSELPQAFARAVKDVRGGKPQFGVTTGFTDMHFFAVDGNVPTIGYGCGGKNAHGVDERVEIKNLIETAQVYAEFMAEFEPHF
jgi:succinyl-diaminopimelate desuccinylase